MVFLHWGRCVESVGLVGFGISNRGVFSYLSRRYPKLCFTVRSDAPQELPRGVRGFFGARQFDELHEDILFLSPTVRADRAELASAEARGVHLTSDASFFCDNTRGTLFAITGSNGKSTTTHLTKRLLEGAFDSAYAIGNIGEAMTPHLGDAGHCAYAAELSSFQLMRLRPVARRAAIVDLTPSHLNWHTSFAEYAAAKENALAGAEERVLPVKPALREAARRYHCFARYSAELDEKEMLHCGAELAIYLRDGAICANGKPLIELAALGRREKHNIENLMAAMALAYGYYDEAQLYEVARSFRGLPHRFELIGRVGETELYDSSIDTSPERTRTTLEALHGKCVLLLGGRSKAHNYEILCEALRQKCTAAVIFGENRDELHAALCGAEIPLELADSLDDAFARALPLAAACKKLLLSPASTSYDGFKSFEERGARFKELATHHGCAEPQ